MRPRAARHAPMVGHRERKHEPSSNMVDVYVGARLRMRRMMLGMSRASSVELLGVTFQQIQKYEKGTNRISARRLKQAAQVLETNIRFFLEGAPAQPSSASWGSRELSPSLRHRLSSSTEGFQLNRAFIEIRDPKVRRRIVDLVVSLAQPDDEWLTRNPFVKTNDFAQIWLDVPNARCQKRRRRPMTARSSRREVTVVRDPAGDRQYGSSEL